MKFPLLTLSNEENLADSGEAKERSNHFKYVFVQIGVSQQYLGVFPVSVLTICRSSMRAFTPASISFLSWGVSGHGYKVALNLRTDDEIQVRICWPKTLDKLYRCCRFTYPSQIFLTLFFSWSPWKKMMKTDLWTWSPCGNVTQLGLW